MLREVVGLCVPVQERGRVLVLREERTETRLDSASATLGIKKAQNADKDASTETKKRGRESIMQLRLRRASLAIISHTHTTQLFPCTQVTPEWPAIIILDSSTQQVTLVPLDPRTEYEVLVFCGTASYARPLSNKHCDTTLQRIDGTIPRSSTHS